MAALSPTCSRQKALAIAGGLFGMLLLMGAALMQVSQSPGVTGGTSGSGATSLSTGQGIDATNASFALNYDGHYVFDAHFTLGANTIDCNQTNDCNFSAVRDNGKACWGTSWSNTGFNSSLSSTVILPEGVLTVTGAQTATCSGGNATANCAGSSNQCFLAWGHYDDTALTAVETANVAACSTVIFPGQSNLTQAAPGPAVMLVKKGHFASNGICTNGTGAIRQGFGYKGKDISSTVFLASPSFDPTQCIGVNGSCFFGSTDGPNVQDIMISGGGISNPGVGFAGKSIMAFVPANNAAVHHVSCMGWGASSSTSGIPYGIVLGGNSLETFYVEEDGCGQTGIRKIGSSGAANQVDVHSLVAYDNSFGNLVVDGSALAANQPMNIFGGLLGGANNGCVVATVGGTGNAMTAHGGNYGGGTGQGENNLVCVGFFPHQGGTTSTTGSIVTFIGSLLAMSGGGGANFIFANGATDIVHVQATTIAGSGTNIFDANVAGGKIYDDGGNVITATGTLFAGSGSMIGSASINSPCVAANLVLTSGWGASTVGTVSGDSHACGFTITGAAGSASPVLTYTFPVTASKPFYIAPRCAVIQTGGTFGTLTNPSEVVTATSDTITFAGTPAAQTYTFIITCQ